MTMDLAVLALLSLAALYGALTGALRQAVSLAAAIAGVVAARFWSADVASGLERAASPLARHLAPILLFVGVAVLASFVGRAFLGATGMSRAVLSPADRAVGAVFGGAKGLTAAWVLLSTLALAGDLAPRGLQGLARASDFAALAEAHNLVRSLNPEAAMALDRAIEIARSARSVGELGSDPESSRLLADPRIRALKSTGLGDQAEAARLMEDPELRALVERLAGRGRTATGD